MLHLPNMGIYGNTHFLMQDMNNEAIAQIILNWLQTKGLSM